MHETNELQQLVMVQQPTRRISELNRSADIGTGYTILDGSHNAENHTQQNKAKQPKTEKQHTQQKTKHTKRKTGIVNIASSVGEKRCLMHHYRVISMA